METFKVLDGYDRKTLRTFRNPRTIAELISHCDSSGHIWFKDLNGTARQAKVNGKVRTWKRDPSRVEIPLKYGLYEYATFDAHDINRVLILAE